MAQFIISSITEFDFDCIVAESIKEHDWNDEVIAAFGTLREKIFGRFMDEMPDELFVKSAIEMAKIWKG